MYQQRECRRRRGFSLAESVIVLVVLALAIWGLLSTAAWSTEVYVLTRKNIGARIVASGWFDVFESLDNDPGVFDMARVAEAVARTLSQNAVPAPGTGFFINGHLVVANEVSSADGMRTIRLSVSTLTNRPPTEFIKRVNTRGNDTVSDDSRG